MTHPRGLPAPLAALDRPLVMGVLNVTADSFSDGGLHLDPELAVAHGMELAKLGADLVDVGGESTRPGAERVPEDVERDRVIPVVRALTDAGILVSIDTMRASVAAAAVKAGAVLVNDVSGGSADAAMLPTLAPLDVPVVLMHWRGHSAHMADLAQYDDVVADVIRELGARIDAAVAAGIARERIIVDPGLGFAKEAEHNWALLAALPALEALGCPVLVGASRKRFLGALLADESGVPRALDDRDLATLAVTALCANDGAWGVRVHDVRGARDAVLVGKEWRVARRDANG
jgi:dihydropteroate synthase